MRSIRVGGLDIAAITGYPIEEFLQMQVLDGLCGVRQGPAGPTGTADYVFHPAGIASDGDFCWWVGHSLEPESARFEIKGCRNSS